MVVPKIVLGTEVSTIGEGIKVEEELVSSDISANQREIRETTNSSQQIINKLDYTWFNYQKDAKTVRSESQEQ